MLMTMTTRVGWVSDENLMHVWEASMICCCSHLAFYHLATLLLFLPCYFATLLLCYLATFLSCILCYITTLLLYIATLLLPFLTFHVHFCLIPMWVACIIWEVASLAFYFATLSFHIKSCELLGFILLHLYFTAVVSTSVNAPLQHCFSV